MAKKKSAAAADPRAGYERHRQAAGRRQSAQSRAGRDIGELPAVADPARRSACERDLHRFCRTYFPESYRLPFSADHRKVIARIEESVLQGGLFALAMPRGSGKTTLCETACLWALVYGHRRYVVLIGATAPAATESLDSIRSELEGNDFLAEDFPEVCCPIQKLDGITQRRLLYKGKRVQMELTSNRIVLPAMPDSKAASGILQVAGIRGRIRGMKYKRPDGGNVRPDEVLVDDCQTDVSAYSEVECVKREKALAGAILGLAGPGQKISGLMPCTKIRDGDVACRILDRELHPEWNGETTKLVYAFPNNTELWEKYAELWREGMRQGDGFTAATEFYRQNREAMDAGAVVAWPERHNADELSALQHAMNLKLLDEDAFWAEYQNTPRADQLGEGAMVATEIAQRLNRLPRRIVPQMATRLTAFIDVQERLLYWGVCAWSDEFTGAAIDYGTWPEQARAHFAYREVRRTLQTVYNGLSLEGQLRSGIDDLTQAMVGREWKREDGGLMRIERCLIDAGWQTDLVHAACRASTLASVLMPSRGRFIGASSNPITDRKMQQGEKPGLNWVKLTGAGRKLVANVQFDANWWKSFLAARLLVSTRDRGALTFFGDNPETHRLISEHCTAEYKVKVEGRGRVVEEWKQKPGADNHLWDVLVGCAVAGSVQGCNLGELPEIKAKQEIIDFAAEQRKAIEEHRRKQRDDAEPNPWEDEAT